MNVNKHVYLYNIDTLAFEKLAGKSTILEE